MSVLRTREQAVLQDALIVTQESADHLEDAAGFVEDEAAQDILKSLADERHHLAQSLADALRNSGDLPNTPDIDREDAVNLVRRIRAWLSPDATPSNFLALHADAERKLRDTLSGYPDCDFEAGERELIEHVAEHVDKAISELESLASRLGQ